jgi:vacuolar-type H+-ATPase subunit H
MEQVYIPANGEATTEDIDITGSLPPSNASEYTEIDQVIQQAEQLLDQAESEAWKLVENLAEDAREKREHEVSIKREHAERYFDSRIQELEDRIADMQSRNQESAEDLRGPIGREKRRLEDLEKEREEELERLDEDEQVVPEEPELVNLAVVVGVFE